VCALIGVGAVWSARELRPTEALSGARRLLVEQIAERQAEGDALLAANQERLAQIERLQDTVLAVPGEGALDRARLLGVASGQTRVSGPGLVVSLADSRAAQEGTPGTDDERVQDV